MASDPASSASRDDGYELDPVFLHARREALVIFSVWLVCLLWTVPVSYYLGYRQDVTPENIPLVLGIPRWTFWGVMFPWLMADIVTTWFCFRYLKTDPLDPVSDDDESSQQSSPTESTPGSTTPAGEDV